eukprot:CAMPEP_0174310424 /NCGR_PEP_ID=MMETSP0810-20121108/3037_1 /TAXON_ID=73025 ORGANISM="Eutreptiella gymnastica-like, Strain CCMP1594" /NCGR_SAMPLE_ID=MMETSP0810 /ASSEMBLY_ACC=CAM_ASM_000659 /LENGTH=59 /DNA_ID=CAMNT_0015418325 /DNA_START=320 /DNA_END=499 /DNA_ORIENTATION=+
MGYHFETNSGSGSDPRSRMDSDPASNQFVILPEDNAYVVQAQQHGTPAKGLSKQHLGIS